MISVTVAGRLGKDSELRQAGSSQVLSFSVAGDTGFGERKQSHWFNCSLWGNQGAALQQYLLKGQQVTVIGEYSEREYDGKQYKELRVNQIELQGGKSDSHSSQQGFQQPTQSNQAPNPYAATMAQNAQGMRDTINNQFAQKNQNPAMNGGGATDDDIPFTRHFDGQF